MTGEQDDPTGEIHLLHAEADAMTEHPPEPPPRRTWVPVIRGGRLVLPARHHQVVRGLRTGSELWRRHPHVRTGGQLTFGERSADVMRNAFGSWAFVGGFLLFMAIWMTLNSLLLGPAGFDKYPYILLNLCLSMMAGLQGALILIAAKRLDRVNAETATAHYAETAKLDRLQTQNNEMTGRIEQATALLAEIHRHVSALSPLSGDFPPDPPEDPQP